MGFGALGENVYFLVDELYILVVKTICKYSFCNLRYASLKLPMSPAFKTPYLEYIIYSLYRV